MQKLYEVIFKKGPGGNRVVHRQLVRADGRLHAIELMKEEAEKRSVFRMISREVPDDFARKQKRDRDNVAFCDKSKR